MGSLADYSELELLDHVCNAAYSQVATVYLGLSTADPGDDEGGLAEPSGNGYVRQSITFGAASSRRVTQDGAITFPEASGAWGTVSHWGIFDAESAGNMLAHGAFAVSKSIVSGNTPSVADTEVYVEYSAAEISDYLAEELLDHMFRNAAYSAPDTYIGLVTAVSADDDDGDTITEVSGGSYAREQVEPNGGSSPTWDAAAAGLVDNTHDITFTTATASWGTVVGVVICDAATSGNLLFYDNDMGDQAVGDGDTVVFSAGDLDVQMS